MSQTTKRALAQSLKRLMARKPLSKITISDITEDCGISRMTFYYHFQDIYDLIALRVITQTVGDCYSALGAVHSLFVGVRIAL